MDKLYLELIEDNDKYEIIKDVENNIEYLIVFDKSKVE